ncbi:MAG: tRNA uridine-5-carboxymethylaminomethyl(34) synthesis enzyme MnmG [Candidatus Omnitrophica bacterium]|nr:tRNA uridine-5-carboxymethylaminomethyl(34) synthesis enzyme MnmG [Candidatus Omnitrophota bacterium]
MKNAFDVIVIGGGHAGCEAALSSARMGCSTLLVTMSSETIGLMSCNPAIGGVGKGQLVKEIDALGGEMARAADTCGIQFRILNASKGPAVWSSRAQIDRQKYNLHVRGVVKSQDKLEILEDEVIRLTAKNNAITGIETLKGTSVKAKTVIVTTGTFLSGLLHIGRENYEAGRMEEKRSSKNLSQSLKDLGLQLSRFNTSTCARLDGKTIDFSKLEIQNGDIIPRPFSFSTKDFGKLVQKPCYLTYTNEKTHQIIRGDIKHSPLFSGNFTGSSVRYCPSLEEKIMKFPHHERHQVFLEPEGMNTDEIYPNGIFTTLGKDTQDRFIHTIPGLENVKINRFGYGVEYDVVPSTQLYPTLETKHVKNLYLAGQINGTTGYEEAASLGLIAGINAALKIKKKKPLILDRSTSYIGVLIDDLVTKGTNEPYRMFTSRVEYRLILREDNADMRLNKIGYELGLVKDKDYKDTLAKKKKMEDIIKFLRETRGLEGKTLFDLLKRPGIDFLKLKELKLLDINLPRHFAKRIESEIKYSGYIKRQMREIKRFKNLEKIKISESLDIGKISGLSNEIKEKLGRFKPLSLGQASRISGITPAAISILMVHLKK